ncbi:MAG TPA: hypothetical protein VGH74_00545 [Planctomycetaceae bacterium]|jgi:hypothetical protein
MVVIAMLALAAFDRSFHSAYVANWVGKPVRGLAAWQRAGSGLWEESDCLADIYGFSVASLSAILLALWIVQRISRGQTGRLVRVAVGFIVFLVALSILCLPHMLDVISGNGPPNG